MSWSWVDYECYEWLYYNNTTGKHLAGAIVIDGHIKTKWDDNHPPAIALTEHAKEILAEMPKPEKIARAVVTYDMESSRRSLSKKDQGASKTRRKT